MMPTLPSASQYIKSGKLVALAVTSDKRHPLAPEILTVAESYPGFEALSWNEPGPGGRSLILTTAGGLYCDGTP